MNEPNARPVVRVRARTPEPGDTVPAAARRLADRFGGDVKYSRAEEWNGHRACSTCGRAVKVKADGYLRAHGGCLGSTGEGEWLPETVECVIVRGHGWAAVWENGSARYAHMGCERMNITTLNRRLAELE